MLLWYITSFMSISSGDSINAQNDEREEIDVPRDMPMLNGVMDDGFRGKIETKDSPPLTSPMFRKGGDGGVTDDSGGGGASQHQRTRPTRARAPKPISNSPIHVDVEGLRERLERKIPFAAPLDGDRSPAPTISSDEGFAFYHERRRDGRTGHEHGINSAASFVVCGVDGTVYTLDAYTGKLKDLFQTGQLVSTSSPMFHASDGTSADSTNGRDDDDDDDAIDDHDSDSTYSVVSKVSHSRTERVIPGLHDGRLYSLFEFEREGSGDDTNELSECQPRGDDNDYDANENCCSGSSQKLTPHHIKVMDVVDSPFSVCPVGDTEQHQCGILMGSKKITIFAIEPTTGKLRWTQDPQGGAGGRGYTTHPPKSSRRGRTVLLQREDYVVRHTDTDQGKEIWKVELGIFSPLVTPQSGRVEDTGNDDGLFAAEISAGSVQVGGKRKRGVAAMAASADSQDKKKSSVHPILGKKKTPILELDDSAIRDRQHTGGRLPTIAFGKDRKSLMAIDEISRELLWGPCQIESEIAKVLGIDVESKWTIPNVIDEGSILTNGQRVSSQNVHKFGSNPSSSPSAGGLTPYGTIDKTPTDNLDSIGRHYNTHTHHSHSFVRTQFNVDEVDFPPFGNHVDYPPSSQGVTSDEIGHGFFSQLSAMNPSDVTMADAGRPLSHRTEHGLYLTWSMVVAVVMIILSIVVLIARVVILRQKRKWERTASLDLTTAPSLSEDGNASLPPSAENPTALSSGNFHMDISTSKQVAVPRSWSVGAMGSHLYNPGHNGAQPFPSGISGIAPSTNKAQAYTSDISRATSHSPDQSPSLNNYRPYAAPSTEGLKSLSTVASSDDKSRPSVDNIDGIPLVRYSRYTSEFKEILPLGRGGFGTVFRCRNVLDGREYAIKKIKIVSPMSIDGNVTKQLSQKLHRVLREVKCLALLDHPNIVRYYTAWLEVDQNDCDDEIGTTASIFDRKSSGIFSGGLFGGFGSNSRPMQAPLSKRNGKYGPAKGLLGSYNPLSWNGLGNFRFEESKSFSALQNDDPNNELCEDDDDDLGFTWERSENNTSELPLSSQKQFSNMPQHETSKVEESQSSSGMCAFDSGKNADVSQSRVGFNEQVELPEPVFDARYKNKATEGRHILFIQMHLCSVQTLADFLSSREARCGAVSHCSSQIPSYDVDIPYALRLFAQIAHGIKHVHKQGLIHRDLKPQNCFIDDAGIVKVGDFGLSRESSSAGDITDCDKHREDGIVVERDSVVLSNSSENTVGVGTQAYASPEQMRGSDYDASTDVFSLGLILFELLYPMFTAMERYKEFACIRKGDFPVYWNDFVKTSFPTIHDLLVQMISDSASERPTADAVSDRIDTLLREYSVQSLDKSWGEKGALLLRVEATEKEGILAHTMQLIRDAAPQSKVLQYGLRGQKSKAIMEFALDIEENEKAMAVENIRSQLENNSMSVRRVSNC